MTKIIEILTVGLIVVLASLHSNSGSVPQAKKDNIVIDSQEAFMIRQINDQADTILDRLQKTSNKESLVIKQSR